MGHTSFSLQLYVNIDGKDTQIMLEPVYFHLDSTSKCMCESMKAVAEDFVSSYSCTITNDECTELQCTVEDSILESLTMTISQCDHPPTVILQMAVNNKTHTVPVTGSISKLLDHAGNIVTVSLQHYDYSIDLAVSAELLSSFLQ